jgi:hypothetical protein
VIALLLLFAAFPHAPHVEKAKLVCLDCHTAPVKFGAEVAYPAVAKCASCHGDRENARVIPETRQIKLKDFVFFDHRMHLKNDVNCEECHAGGGAAQNPTTMKFCQTCHTKMRAASGCNTCHDPR